MCSWRPDPGYLLNKRKRLCKGTTPRYKPRTYPFTRGHIPGRTSP